MDAREASEYLRINEQTLRRMARDGEVPAFKVGRVWRFQRRALEKWAQNRQAGAGRQAARLVLVIDDHIDVYYFVREVLKNDGYTVISATGGEEALRKMEDCRPDFVFLDLKMPDMSGAETIGEIRARFGQVPVAIFTAYPDSDLMSQALQHGPLLLLRKPCRTEQIRECVNGYFREKS